MTQDNEPVVFNFYFPKESASERKFGIRVKHHDVEFQGIWDEDSEYLEKVIASFPKMLEMITEEYNVQKEISGMSAEIDKLLDNE